MWDALNGIEAKLGRADFHLKAIEAEVRPIIEAEPDRIPGEFNPQSGTYFFRAQRDSRSGDWLSPVIGDFAHNLRAALDYIVWALTTDEVRSSKHASKIEFPIFIDRDAYPEAAKRKLMGVDKQAARVIECLQPFNGPNCRPNFSLAHPTEKPLWHLFELDKWDKHRALNLTEHVGKHTMGFTSDLGIYTAPTASTGPSSFKRGAIFAEVELTHDDGTPNPDVEMYLSTTYDVAFDREGPTSVAAEPLLKTLYDIRAEVGSRVLPSLLKFLPRP